MTTIVIPNRPAGGDARSIASLLANFDAITSVVNGNIDSANIASGGVKRSNLNVDIVSAGTSLPVAPVDGQEFYYIADATLGVVWHLRYRAASASAYKWEFVGGSYLYSQNIGASGVTGTGSGFSELAGGAGPDVIVPLAGDYEADYGAEAYNSAAATNVVNLSVGLTGAGGVSTTPIISASMGSVGGNQIGRAQAVGVLPGLAAGLTVRMRYVYVAISTIVYQNRQFRIRPRRVG